MKAHLLFGDRDIDIEAPESPQSPDLIDDLELSTLFAAMADGDELVAKTVRSVILAPLDEPDQIVYRQHVLNDCLHEPEFVRSLYDLAGEALVAERSVFRGFFSERPETLLNRSVKILELFLDLLRRLRKLVLDAEPRLRSSGFQSFVATIRTELDDAYFAEVEAHLKQLKLRDGLLLSARLGEGSQSIDLVIRQPRPENRSFFNRIGLKKPTFSYTVPDRDEAGQNALAEFRDRGLESVANAAAQSSDHVLAFFTALRTEAAFYVGCLNLETRIRQRTAQLTFPTVTAPGCPDLTLKGLYDICLQLRIDRLVVTNTVEADGMNLVVVTGANQGGKSTFLRSVGLAHLMAAAGMFVPAQEMTTAARAGVYTHFKREEDESMTSGKFDEELARMSAIADTIAPHALLLCNESFQSTNEREASEIGRQVVDAMVRAGVMVVFVTHLYDMGSSYYQRREEIPALFLRADRDESGARPFQLILAEPLPTSYGEDVYERIIPSGDAARGTHASGADAGEPDAAQAGPSHAGPATAPDRQEAADRQEATP